jgi:hypothetical protein
MAGQLVSSDLGFLEFLGRGFAKIDDEIKRGNIRFEGERMYR